MSNTSAPHAFAVTCCCRRRDQQQTLGVPVPGTAQRPIDSKERNGAFAFSIPTLALLSHPHILTMPRRHSRSKPGSHCHEQLYTVIVVGAAGGIGLSLSLLVKSNAHIGRWKLVNVAPLVTSFAMDTDTSGVVNALSSKEKLADAVKGSGERGSSRAATVNLA